MSASSPDQTCPHCGSALPAGVPESQCPRCLMAQIMEPTQAGDHAAAIPPLSPEALAPHFPQLEILECLGRGGMGVVYKARQKSLNRLVALKLLAPERVDDPQFAARFEKEAQALAALNHPHIVGVYDFGQAGGFYYLLMEFVDGVNLRQLLQSRRLTPKEALSIVPPVCDALQCAHDHGIVHRDIKPENLLIDRNGVVKIADFGIAKIVHSSDLPPQDEQGASHPEAATMPFGTPDYAAPEQANGTADHRADIYSLGVVLYEMLTGERPKDKIEAPSKRVQVDIRIDEIVLRALEKAPELRFATAAEFRTQVENVKNGEPNAQAAVLPRIQFRFVEERDGRRVIVWRGVLLAVCAVFALALIVGSALLLVASGAPPALVIVGFAGIAALLTVATLVLNNLKSGASPHCDENVAADPPRFSRIAVAGACWVPAAMAALIAAWLMLPASRDGAGPSWWQGLAVPLLILAVAGPFGTTILGWLAVSQIRRSGGRLHGLQLAVFDGLLFPLMALSALIALAGIALPNMFAEFYANPSIIGNPAIRPPLVTRVANGLSQYTPLIVLLAVAIAIAVNVLIVRAVMRAVRKNIAAAPREGSATASQVKLASLALIFALMSTMLGAFAAMRAATAWPVMALAFLFAGIAIFMALPVRRVGTGMSALIVATLGMVLWSLASLIVRRADAAALLNAPPEIERIEVTAEQAVIKARGSSDAGMILLFGSGTNRWTPANPYLEAMFDVTMEKKPFEQGVRWIIKLRRGTRWDYHLDDPAGAKVGKVVFHPGTPTPEADGSYVIAEFRPDEGEPLPIAVKLEQDKPAPPVGANVSAGAQASTSLVSSATIERARRDFATTKQLFEAGSASRLQMLEAETHLKSVEALFAGDQTGAARARLNGARDRLKLFEALYSAGQASASDVAKAGRALAEAEAELHRLEFSDPARQPVRRTAAQPGTYPIKPGLSLVIAESPRGKLDRGPIIDAQLIWQQPGESSPSDTYDIRLAEGMPYAIDWREDGGVFWVRCSAEQGSGADRRVYHFLRVLTIRAPGEVEETMTVERAVSEAEAELRPMQGRQGAGKANGAADSTHPEAGLLPLPASLAAADSLPSFWAENAGGQIVQLTDAGVRGGWVMVEFWSLTDRDREKTEQALRQLRRQFESEDRLLIWSVCVEEERDVWMKEMDERHDLVNTNGNTNKFNSDHRWWQLILGWQGDAQWRGFLVRCGLSELPQYFLINPAGKLTGRLEPSKLEEILSRHLTNTASGCGLPLPSAAELKQLSWREFDQTPGQYWRALADAKRYRQAAEMIERYLALHPELSDGAQRINGANLHFHAAQCRAFAEDKEGALKHIAIAKHKQPTPGGLLWNDYLDGTEAFLRDDKPALQAARDKLAAGPDINKDNVAALDRLITHFGKSYREACSARLETR